MIDPESLFDRPVIVLAAPRSGSTLLFETLSQAPGVWTVGGESHQFIEGLRPLNPMYGTVDSNRLLAGDSDENINAMLRRRFARSLRDRRGRKIRENRHIKRVRFLEKTPKNSLRQPFLDRVFPGALYLFLYREPRSNLSSMMEAWKAGRWVTYRRLPGWKGPPWSLLLPPGWQAMNGRSLQEICAFQWISANQVILDDLENISADRWMACSYDQLTRNTEDTACRICTFAGLEMDDHFLEHLSAPLPLSRYTHTAPSPDKWRKNEAEILEVMDQLADVQQRCEALIAGSESSA
jgi:hypothetical protein